MPEWIRHAFTREALSHPTSVRVDVVGDLMYVGIATVGTEDSDPYWQIKRVQTTTTGSVTVVWADGDDKFDNVWAGRTGLSYL